MTENNRTIVIATYSVCSEFVVPEGIDLKDAEDWYVKYDTLRILMKDGRRFVVEPRYAALNGDLKRPDKTETTKEDIHPDDYKDEDFVAVDEL